MTPKAVPSATRNRLRVLAALVLWPAPALAPTPIYFDVVGLILMVLAWFLALLMFGIASLRSGAHTSRIIVLCLLAIPVVLIAAALVYVEYTNWSMASDSRREASENRREAREFEASLRELCRGGQRKSHFLEASEPSWAATVVQIDYPRTSPKPDGTQVGADFPKLTEKAVDQLRMAKALCMESRIRGLEVSVSGELAPNGWQPVCRRPNDLGLERSALGKAEYTLRLGRQHGLRRLESPSGSVDVSFASAELVENHSGRKLFETSICTGAHSLSTGQMVIDERYAELAKLLAKAAPVE
jgi:hypothetical protein